MAIFTTTRLASLAIFAPLLACAAVLHEQLSGVPAGWSHASTPSDSHHIVLQVALAQQNLDKLEAKLLSVSTPGLSTYGDYMDVEETNAMFAPSSASKKAVEDWLTASGVSNFKNHGQLVSFSTTVGNANKMLGTKFAKYHHARTGMTKLRTTQYSVPESLSQHIDLIAPTTYFGNPRSMTAAQPKAAIAARELQGRATQPASCNGTVIHAFNETFYGLSPACLKTVYGVGNYKPNASSGSTIAFGSFLNQSASFSDLALFEKRFGIPSQNFSVVLVNDGATDLPQPPPVADVGEANLDVQNIVGIAHPLPVTEFITAGSPPFLPTPLQPNASLNQNEPYLPYYEYLIQQKNADLPMVITNSYGDEEQSVPPKYATRVCNLIGILGLKGISVLESSGDEGVGASCRASDGTNKPQFNPIFPATCPYLTSVGGTVLFDPEEAWDGSSGGFSGYFAQPKYQNAAVGKYLSNYISPATKAYYGKYVNFTGRGFPDISAHSVHPDYSVYVGGELNPSGGTSAAAPVTAAIFALINDARLSAGKKQLGFLNPIIYYIASTTFNDVTLGQSNGCDGFNTQSGLAVPGAGVIPGAHWNATVGWDPVTGFGTPNFSKLLTLAMAL